MQTFRAILIHELIKAFKARFDAEKIEISYPVRKMYGEYLVNKEKTGKKAGK